MRKNLLTFAVNTIILQLGGEELAEKTITIRITEEQYKEIKIKAVNKGLTLKDYILALVESDSN